MDVWPGLDALGSKGLNNIDGAYLNVSPLAGVGVLFLHNWLYIIGYLFCMCWHFQIMFENIFLNSPKKAKSLASCVEPLLWCESLWHGSKWCNFLDHRWEKIA